MKLKEIYESSQEDATLESLVEGFQFINADDSLFESMESELGKLTAIAKAGKPLSDEQIDWFASVLTMQEVLANYQAFNLPVKSAIAILSRTGDDDTANKYVLSKAQDPTVARAFRNNQQRVQMLGQAGPNQSRLIQRIDQTRLQLGQIQRKLQSGAQT